jgi:hypothetical protein
MVKSLYEGRWSNSLTATTAEISMVAVAANPTHNLVVPRFRSFLLTGVILSTSGGASLCSGASSSRATNLDFERELCLPRPRAGRFDAMEVFRFTKFCMHLGEL